MREWSDVQYFVKLFYKCEYKHRTAAVVDISVLGDKGVSSIQIWLDIPAVWIVFH